MPEKYYKIPDKLWEQIKCLMPKEKSKPLGGRPPVSYRVVLAGIYYKLQTGVNGKLCLHILALDQHVIESSRF